MLQAKRERPVCGSHCSNTFIPCMPRKIFHVGNVLLLQVCHLCPQFDHEKEIVTEIYRCYNVGCTQHVTALLRPVKCFLCFYTLLHTCNPWSIQDIRTQVHRGLIQLLLLEHPQNANCKHDADTSS